MYGNLYIEMKKKDVSQADISKRLGITSRAMSNKIRGKTDFTTSEMFTIKNEFFSDKTLEYLFTKN